MGYTELFLIAVGLSMDAFAVAVCKGLNMRRINIKHTAVIAFFFGAFQAIMPFIGWVLGNQFKHYIESVDHWVTFILLGIIGGKMLWEAIYNEEEPDSCDIRINIKELFVLAIATSIDALAVGITFAISGVKIGRAISLIGLTTFVLSAIGVIIGNKFGIKYKSKAEFAGGIILILIGLKILFEHLGVINF
ncbi:MAG: manganese efflux pump MntP family protein [Monoglobales bacterium]